MLNTISASWHPNSCSISIGCPKASGRTSTMVSVHVRASSRAITVLATVVLMLFMRSSSLNSSTSVLRPSPGGGTPGFGAPGVLPPEGGGYGEHGWEGC